MPQLVADLHVETGVFSVQLPQNAKAPVTPHGGYLCLDFDTFVMDSGTKKDKRGLSSGLWIKIRIKTWKARRGHKHRQLNKPTDFYA